YYARVTSKLESFVVKSGSAAFCKMQQYLKSWTLATGHSFQHNRTRPVHPRLHGYPGALPMTRKNSRSISRRKFLSTAAAGAAAVVAAPAVITAGKTDSKTIVGEGDYKYEIIHEWPQLPDKFTWQTTHNVAVDRAANLYVIHEGRKEQAEHPSIFVFDSDGEYVRSFGKQFQGGGHGIEIRDEAGQEFLYV